MNKTTKTRITNAVWSSISLVALTLMTVPAPASASCGLTEVCAEAEINCNGVGPMYPTCSFTAHGYHSSPLQTYGELEIYGGTIDAGNLVCTALTGMCTTYAIGESYRQTCVRAIAKTFSPLGGDWHMPPDACPYMGPTSQTRTLMNSDAENTVPIVFFRWE